MKKKSARYRNKGSLLCLVTVPDEKLARKIALSLVNERLAACVNIIRSVDSIYRWEGKTVKDKELVLMIKTKGSLKQRIELRIRSLHSYTVPEIIFIKIDSGYRKYLEWLHKSTRAPKDNKRESI